METRTTEYQLTNCNPACTHFGGIVVTEAETYDPIDYEPYIARHCTPQCAMSAELATRRAVIYARAFAAADAIPYTFGGSTRRACTRKHEAWREVANEFTEAPCPLLALP